MKIRLIPSNTNGDPEIQFLTSLLVDQSTLFDAGSAGFSCHKVALQKITNIFISHAHLDHVASLPSLLEAYIAFQLPPPMIWGSAETLLNLKELLFNNRLWPDFFELGSPKKPLIRVSESVDYRPIPLDGLRVTPIPVSHVITTQGYLVESDSATVMISSDTGPTTAFWEIANQQKRLDAIILEVAFPDSMQALANAACHLTPKAFGKEVAKLTSHDPQILAVHLKPWLRSKIVQELQDLNLKKLVVARSDCDYQFPDTQIGTN